MNTETLAFDLIDGINWVVEINPDFDPVSPVEECYLLSTLVTAHPRYNIGHSNGLEDLRSIVVEFAESTGNDELHDRAYSGDLAQLYRLFLECKLGIALPLYLLDHSGLSLSASPFGCPWDSSLVGYAFVSFDRIASEYGSVDAIDIDKAIEVMRLEIESVNQFLRGDIYGYTIKRNGETVDSLWGLYGLGYARETALEEYKRQIERYTFPIL